MIEPSFDNERARLEAAQRHLQAQHFDEFQRLAKTVLYGPPFQMLFIDCTDELLRDRVIDALADVARPARLRVTRLPIGSIEDVAQLEARFAQHARLHEIVHVVGAARWFDSSRWASLNARRERLAEAARARLLFWLDPEAIATAARSALDLWAWRAGVYVFQTGIAQTIPGLAAAEHSPTSVADNRSMRERHLRIATLREWLEAVPSPHDELKGALLDELGRLLVDVGDYDAALKHLRDVELAFHDARGDLRSRAVTLGRIAEVLQLRGQTEEALRILREEQLPIFEKVGDLHSRALTMGQIADALHLRGELDEALRIRREEELPMLEQLGDSRARAMTMGKIADIVEFHGQLDEALSIRREELLPVFEKLGDQRSRAITLGGIADTLKQQGKLTEALRVLRDEVLPVFEKLGDLHSRAVTLDRIADVLQLRGQAAEALRIRQQVLLSIFDQLGDRRSRALTMGKIADVLEERGQVDEALRIRREEQLPVYEQLGDLRERAVTMGKVADMLQARGQLDEALRIRREEEMPVYERLGNRRELLTTRAKVAMNLIRRDGRVSAEAEHLLRQTLADMRRLRTPEATQTEQFMREVGISP